jgi:hypothetical protein
LITFTSTVNIRDSFPKGRMELGTCRTGTGSDYSILDDDSVKGNVQAGTERRCVSEIVGEVLHLLIWC